MWTNLTRYNEKAAIRNVISRLKSQTEFNQYLVLCLCPRIFSLRGRERGGHARREGKDSLPLTGRLKMLRSALTVVWKMNDLLLSQRNSQGKNECPNSLIPSKFNSGLVLPVTILDYSVVILYSFQSNHHYISKADRPKHITALEKLTRRVPPDRSNFQTF